MRIGFPITRLRERIRLAAAGAAVVALATAAIVYVAARADDDHQDNPSSAREAPPTPDADHVELRDSQMQMVRVGSVSERSFPLERQAVGSIDFNEDMATQVFAPYPGRIVRLFAKLGDSVTQGQVLYTIQSPDLIQADSALISAAGVLDLTTRALQRAKQLHEVQGIADKDLEQATSDQMTAEGALKAARDAVAVFGKTGAEIDRMIRTRVIDPYLVVRSPIAGRITARNAAPGLYVQPGNPPAPYSVADVSHVWMNASVAEDDMPVVHTGEGIDVSVMAFPGHEFAGHISAVGATVDPQLHRGLVRAEIEDPEHRLLPGMFVSFVIVVGDPVRAAAVPLNGVVREGDGTMTVWVTRDRHHFVKRTVRIGLQHEGYDEVLEGVAPGDQIVTDGAVFLDSLASGDES